MVDFITVPFGMNSSALEIFEVNEEELVREYTYRNGNITHKSNALYCPRCSKVREKDTLNTQFWKPIFENTDFKEFIMKQYQIGHKSLVDMDAIIDGDTS